MVYLKILKSSLTPEAITLVKKRTENKSNYSAIFLNGKTIRIPLDQNLPITELDYPEFYDLSFGDKCDTGKCPWCYAKGNPKGKHYSNIVDKLKNYFGSMDSNQRPFQVAIGGQQEPLEHPEFWLAVKTLKELDIVPNYTTNGVLFDDEVAELTKKYCGGVAITLHPHLEVHWKKAIDVAQKHNIKTNIHYVVSDENSITKLEETYYVYGNLVDYFVLLPHMNVGYAEKDPKKIDYKNLELWLDKTKPTNIAFGANFYEFLNTTKKWDVSLYTPEILSKYLVLDDNMKLYKSSFELEITK
jgi:sulfatase maturation enzyme AslB (radical SAM superfamily)